MAIGGGFEVDFWEWLWQSGGVMVMIWWYKDYLYSK